jgi:hypothetical protein
MTAEIVPLLRKTFRREIRLIDSHDTLLNNTSKIIELTDAQGKHIESLRPGSTYITDKPVTVFFDASPSLTFRSYINEEMALVESQPVADSL